MTYYAQDNSYFQPSYVNYVNQFPDQYQDQYQYSYQHPYQHAYQPQHPHQYQYQYPHQRFYCENPNANEYNDRNYGNDDESANPDDNCFSNEEQDAYNKFLQSTGQHRRRYASEQEEIDEIEEEEERDAELEQVAVEYYSHPEFGPIQPPIEHDPLSPPPPLDFDDVRKLYHENKKLQLFMLKPDGFWNIVTLSNIDQDGFNIYYPDGKQFYIHAIEGVFPVFYLVPPNFQPSNANKLSTNSNNNNNNNINKNNNKEKHHSKKLDETELIGKELLINSTGKGIIPMTFIKYDEQGRSLLKEKDDNVITMYLESFEFQIIEKKQ